MGAKGGGGLEHPGKMRAGILGGGHKAGLPQIALCCSRVEHDIIVRTQIVKHVKESRKSSVESLKAP